MTIIGFVNRDSATVSINCTLPVGFTRDRQQTREWQNAAIIMVDDCQYQAVDVRCPNSGNVLVSLYLHGNNHEEWESQIKWVRDMGWDPQGENRFNHIAGDRFWDIAKRLLLDAGLAL